MQDIKDYAIENDYDGFTLKEFNWGDTWFYKNCSVEGNPPSSDDLTYKQGVTLHLHVTQSCPRTEEFLQSCDFDPYKCLRDYRGDQSLQATLDQRAVASYFEKYRTDMDNFSLFIWGYAMNMLDFYEANDMLLSPQDVGEQERPFTTFFGEFGHFPQLKKVERGQKTTYFIMTSSDGEFDKFFQRNLERSKDCYEYH